MIGPRPWLASASDPLAQLVGTDPALSAAGPLTVLSQQAALVHWPQIEGHSGPVHLVLRRAGGEEEAEWRDQLALLQHLLNTTRKDIRFSALSPDAAHALSLELGRAVTPLPLAAPGYGGQRALRLLRQSGVLHLALPQDAVRPARQFNLARLRRVARLQAEDADPDLRDFVHYANGDPEREPPPAPAAPRIVMVVPNGYGLGHVTRLLAIARVLKTERNARIVFWSFSRAAGLIARFGFEVYARQTARHLSAEPKAWQAWETAEFASLLRRLIPDLVVQDAASLDDFVIDALAQPGTGAARLALLRRGMWQKHILGTDPLAAETLADLIIEPGDLAALADQGLTRGRAAAPRRLAATVVSAPVTLNRPAELMDRKRARKALGLGRGRHCLITLGSDVFNDWTHLLRELARQAQSARIKLVWAQSPLAAPEPLITQNPGIAALATYPLAPHLAAFDGIVSAAGYNSFHEVMQLYAGPVLLAPRQHSALDDQQARALYAQEQGWALAATPGAEYSALVAHFLAQVRSGDAAAPRPAWQDGAQDIATRLARMIETGEPDP